VGDSEDELFVFAHMPKTGGQSLRTFFARHPALRGRFVYLVHAHIRNGHLGMTPTAFEQQPPEERMRTKVILGHVVNKQTHTLLPGRIPRHIVLVREPAETLVSYYNHQMKQARLADQPAVDFEQWYDRSKRDNLMTRWLLTEFMMEPCPERMTGRELKQVQAMLQTFWFVGCTEYLDRDAPILFRRMGLSGVLKRTNVAGLHHEKIMTLDNRLRQRLRAENPLDVELHDYWKAQLDQTLERIRAEIEVQSQAQARKLSSKNEFANHRS